MNLKNFFTQKSYLQSATANVKPRKITFEELEQAKANLALAENHFQYGAVEDTDTNALRVTIAEMELSKLLAAQKRFEGEAIG